MQGGNQCATTVIAYLADNSNSGRATCATPLDFQRGCAGAVYAGALGPVLWASATRAVPVLLTLAAAVLAMLL